MRNIWIIARREYNQYFDSPLAYMVAFLLLVVLGIFFALNIVYYAQNVYAAFSSTPDAGIVTGPFAFMLVLSLPALTMRLLADEQRMGTMELLLTAPIRDWELVVGKWLGSFLFMLTIIAVTGIFPLILNQLTVPGIDLGQLFTSYLGIILVTASFLAVGVGISAMFKSQVAAFFATLVTFVVLWWMIGFPASVLPTGSAFFRYMDMKAHFYDSLITGVINLSDIVYYLSLTALGLFMGTTVIETRRW